MLGKKIRTVIRAIFLVFACVIITIGFVSVFNFTSLKQAKAVTGPAPGWTTESATPLANKGMYQTVCLTATNCLGIGVTSITTMPFALYSSSDGGQTWNINPSISINGQNNGSQFSPVNELSCPSSTVCYLNTTLNGSTFGSPIYETTNAGTTWTNVSTSAFSGYTVDSLSCVSTTVCVVTAASGSNVPSILVTVNSGTTWTSETVPSSITSSYSFGDSSLSCNTAGLCMIVTKTTPGISTSSIVILSTDSGSTWTDITSDFGSNVIYGVNCSNFNTAECLATTTGAVYISTNSGTSWTQTTSSPLSGIQLVTAFCAASSQCYAIGNSSSLIFETTNSGSTWTQLTVPASATSSVLISGACVNASDCVVSGGLASTLETGFTLVTSNGGSTFSYYVISPTGTPSFLGISCPLTTTSCYALTSTGVDYSSNSGASWINESFPSSFFGLGISCPSASTCYVAGVESSVSGTTNGVLYTSNSGTTWTYQVFGNGSFTNIISMGLIACNSVTSCVVANMGNTSSGSQQALYYTTNSGGTWSLGTPPSAVNTSPIFTGINCAISSTDCMITGISGYYPNSTNFLEETTNSGSTWSVLSSSSTTSLTDIDCPSSQVCYGQQQANGTPALVQSTDGGISWTTLSTTLVPIGISCISTAQCSIYTTDGGPTSFQVYTTLDSGANWYSSPLPQVQSENVNLNSNSISCSISTDCQLVGTTATQNVILGLNFAAPSAPLSVSAVVSGTSVGVSWSPPANDGGASPSSYTISGTDTTTSTSVTSVTLSGNPPGTTVNIPSLTEGDSYVFSVTATNIFGTGPGGTSNSVAIPLIPVISSLSPTSGPAAGGTSVTITGSNFTNTDTVNFSRDYYTIHIGTQPTVNNRT